jgi:hypothetical protein
MKKYDFNPYKKKFNGKRKKKKNPNSPDFEEFLFFESPDFLMIGFRR